MSDKIKHIVKEIVKKLKETSSTGGGGASMSSGTGPQYATKYSFSKGTNEKGVKNPYYYKLGWKAVPNKIKGSGLEVKKLFEIDPPNEIKQFQEERIQAFENIEKELNSLFPMISNAKNDTIVFYSENPGSNEVMVSTDLILEYIQDIKKLLKEE
jgi:hypothetical protein